MSSYLNERIKVLKDLLEDLYRRLRIEEKSKRLEDLNTQMASSDFWSDQDNSKKVIEEIKMLKDDVEGWRRLSKEVENIEEVISLIESEDDACAIEKEIRKMEKEFREFRCKRFFADKFSSSNAIVEINAGAGGTESCDWVEMLFRMYVRWAEKKNFKVKIVDELKGEEAGIKNITFIVEGKNAYGLLKGESGVHRLVRISPFDANKRRHTSFASVNVLPEIKDESEVSISPTDLKIETFRASGHGGQHVNVTDSAVRITHIPTGITVSCQNERSQYQNKQRALEILRAKLYLWKKREEEEKLKQLSKEKKEIEWGSQIRSYILHPYLLVKDHRTNSQRQDAYTVLDGEIDSFIEDYLLKELN